MTSGAAENLASPFLDEDFQKNAYPTIARLRENLLELTPMGVFKRPQNFPVDFGG